MTYYCGSCLNKGVVTRVPKDKVYKRNFRCPYEQRLIPRRMLQSHRIRPDKSLQSSLSEFFD